MTVYVTEYKGENFLGFCKSFISLQVVFYMADRPEEDARLAPSALLWAARAQ